MSDVVSSVGRKQKKKKNKSVFMRITFAVILLISLICGVISYRYAVASVTANKDEPLVVAEGKGVSVEIPLGSGTRSIADILKEKGVIDHPWLFKLISKINGFDNTYQSGEHEISVEWSYTDIMRALSDKASVPSAKVTIPEGFTYVDIAKRLEEKKVVKKSDLDKAMQEENFDYKFLENVPKNREFRLQGYLFPETYFFNVNSKPTEVAKKMLDQFNKVFTEEQYDRAKELNMSVDDIITLASLVEREAKISDERPQIAGVFYNRLKSKDSSLRKLQSCASIQYIFYMKNGEVKEHILTEDTKVEDPYNTYIHEGLPPGPICSPGEDSINAVLYPEKHSYLYFVAKDDGTNEHYFSKTYKEHLNAQAKAQKNRK